MAIRNTGGLDLSSIPSSATQHPSTFIAAIRMPTRAVADSSSNILTLYHEPSNGQHGFRSIKLSDGYLFGRETGNNSGSPDGSQEWGSDFSVNQYSGYDFSWIWVCLDVVGPSLRTLRVQTNTNQNTANLAQLPIFTKAAFLENTVSELLMAQAHFLNASITDAQWSQLLAGTLDISTLPGYLDGFEFKDNLVSKNGILSITPRSTPTFEVANNPTYFSSDGVVNPPEPTSTFRIYHSGMTV